MRGSLIGVTRALARVTPTSAFLLVKRRRLRSVLRQAMKAPYYREVFASNGVDIGKVRAPRDLGSFFLERSVLRDEPEKLLCEKPDMALESSGTSGHIARVYLSRRELYANSGRGRVLCDLLGLNESDRLLCTLDLAFGLGSVLVDTWVRDLRLFAMVVGRVDPLDAYRRLERYGFNVIVSDPFWLARLTEVARAHGYSGGLKLMIGGGEGVTRENRARLQEFWQAPLCMTYASTESASALGFECLYQTGYHVNNCDFYMEIDAPDEEGYGELVITTLSRRVMPLIRYRTGDVARWVSGPCACGFPFRRLLFRGRVDEQVSCAWGNLHPDFFENLMSSVPALPNEWQVAIVENAGKPVIQFRMELGPHSTEREALRRHILGALREQSPSALHACEEGLIDVEFRFLEKGRLRKGHKLLRLVDERGYDRA